MIHELRRRIPEEEFDYQTLMGLLAEYDRPRDKIRALLRQKAIIRVKKGLYVFGPTYARKPFSREILANLIYGPSYVSLQFALQYYGLIPERVETLTSVTPGRARRFHTPVGVFAYRHISLAAYSIGIQRAELSPGRFFLIAAPEKALADMLHADRGTPLRGPAAMREYLDRHWRIDWHALGGWNVDLLAMIARRYRSRKIKILADVIRRLASEGGSHE
jgi:hypothetical protein